ncbi:hypothetical protein KI387_021987, partial [Taxus chinensis]
AVVSISAAILLLLFLVQSYGTGKVSFLFCSVTIIWFMANTLIGVYNIVKCYAGAFKAINRYYIIYFFNKNGKHGWLLLKSAVFAITEGAGRYMEDMYSSGDFQSTSNAKTLPTRDIPIETVSHVQTNEPEKVAVSAPSPPRPNAKNCLFSPTTHAGSFRCRLEAQ